MATYSIIPNANYNSNPILNSLQLIKIEKIIWFKKVGDLLNPGDLICEIHYSDCIIEMECYEKSYLLYQNRDTEISFCNILSVYGEKNESITAIFEKYKMELKQFDHSNFPLFKKLFSIENIIIENNSHLID